MTFDVWRAVADERCSLADEVAGLSAEQLDAPSRCGGWRVREVLGHLVWLAERSTIRVVVDGARAHPLPSVAITKLARRSGHGATGGELAARLRDGAHGRGRAPLAPPAAALGEVLAHRADIAAACGLEPRKPDDALRAVLELYRRLWFAFGVPRSITKVRFEPDGAGWTVGPEGGATVAGPADEVLLAACGRQADVSGPGVTLLGRPG